jgi:hypothetical protein
LRNGGFGAYFESNLLNQSSGFFCKFGAKKPPLRKAAKTLHAMFAQRTV